jgi:hypothetical protein
VDSLSARGDSLGRPGVPDSASLILSQDSLSVVSDSLAREQRGRRIGPEDGLPDSLLLEERERLQHPLRERPEAADRTAPNPGERQDGRKP